VKPAVTLAIPALLRDVAGAAELRLRAATLREALEEAYRRVPALRFHFCEDDGGFRAHVLCFVNDVNTRTLRSPDVRLKPGDRISILQAVSGG
jgi:molybdopterin converting factor small subunit